MSNNTPSILIVDDEPDLREILEDRFQLFNFKTMSAESGDAAWELVQKNKFDVVLSDIRMPNGTGLELLKKIKSANIDSPAVFLMTGFHEDFTQVDMLNIGADGFLAKPFDATQIRNTIQKSIVPPKDRWSAEGRFSTTKSLSASIQQVGKDFKIGRRGFSVRAEAQDLKIGEIGQFHIHGAIELNGLGKLIWRQNTTSETIGIEILYLDPASLGLYLDLLAANKPVAAIPAL